MKKYIFVAIMVLGIGCADMGNANMKVDLENGEYSIVSLEIDDTKLKVPQNVSLNIEDSRIGGNAGCNRYFAEMQRVGNNISFGYAGSTKMMCHDDEVNTFEYQFLKNLENDFTLSQDGSNFVLENSSIRLVISKN